MPYFQDKKGNLPEMGGCRCYFRDCRVSSYRNPGAHFFHLPLKDTERNKLWVKYAKLEAMMDYPFSRKKNIVLCSRHFRDECFMNYKKDKLTAKAVPTLHRLSKDKALDYELDLENGVLVTIPEPQYKHLIPPPEFECSLSLDNDEYLWEMLMEAEKRSSGEETIANTEKDDEDSMAVIEAFEDIIDSSAASTNVLQSDESNKLETTQTSLLKRSNKISLEEEGDDTVLHVYKRIKTLNNSQRLGSTSNSQTAETTFELDNLNNKTTTIINHQIIGADGNIWIEQESYNIAKNGADYEFIEISNDEHHVVSNADIEKPNISLDVADEDTEDIPFEEEQCNSEQCLSKIQEMEYTNSLLMEEKTNLENDLLSCQTENNLNQQRISALDLELISLKTENENLRKQLNQTQSSSDEMESSIKEKYERQLEAEQVRNTRVQQQVMNLQRSLDLVKQQLADAKANLCSVQKENADTQNEKIEMLKQQTETNHKLQILQEKYDKMTMEHCLLEKNHSLLQSSHAKLKEDYTKLESQQNQVSTVTTSNNNLKKEYSPQAVAKQANAILSANSLTKAQLFNGIKRYISSSMLALLRMEMFGSTDREWKPDERQVSVDLLRLGESVYKYFTDEWRLRLPGLRDVHIWLSQAVNLDEEEDL